MDNFDLKKYLVENRLQKEFQGDESEDGKITLTKEELKTFLDDWDTGTGIWSDTSRRIVKFLGYDPSDGL